MTKSPAPMTDPDAPVKLDASSKSSLAASIRTLSSGQRGWISMKEAAALFSAKDADYPIMRLGRWTTTATAISHRLPKRPQGIGTTLCRPKIAFTL
jgi:hypothetical protein